VRGAAVYCYAFNGKEIDDSGEWGNGTTAYDYGFRIYNPQLARFLSVDPLSPDYPELTPYQYASNSPVWAIDLDGLEALITTSYHVTRDGKGNFYLREFHRPMLTKVDGEWSGYKQESQFFYKKELYKYLSDIPGYNDWVKYERDKTRRIAKNTVGVGAGLLTIAAAIPSGGTSLTLTQAFVGTFAFSSGVYNVASNGASLILNLNDQPEVAEKIPSGVLNATVGLVIKSQIEDEEVTQTLDATLSIIEGVATFNFKDADAIKTADNLLNMLNNATNVDVIVKEVIDTSDLDNHGDE
jgi:RHS repeat-associated protein